MHCCSGPRDGEVGADGWQLHQTAVFEGLGAIAQVERSWASFLRRADVSPFQTGLPPGARGWICQRKPAAKPPLETILGRPYVR